MWVTELSGSELRARLRHRGVPALAIRALLARRDEPATILRLARILG